MGSISFCFHPLIHTDSSKKTLLFFSSSTPKNHSFFNCCTSRTRLLCSSTSKDGPDSVQSSADTNNYPSNFCIIEGPETVQDFGKMQFQEIQDNIRSRRNKIFLLMEEVRRLRIQQRLKTSKNTRADTSEYENEMPDIPSTIPFLPNMTPKTLKQLYLTSFSFIAGIMVFGGLLAPILELKLGIGGTSYEDFIRNLHLPMQLSQVDPIVASFSGGAVGVISALMLIEANNVVQQEKKMCKYCLGSGYLACARCSASGKSLSIEPIAVNSSPQPLRAPSLKRCTNCSGTGKVMCPTCLCHLFFFLHYFLITMEEIKGNIVLFPFMAQGHIIPFLALAFKLEQKGYQITFINTPLNIKKLKSSLPSNSSIHFLEVPFNSTDHGLPQDAEITDSLPYNLAFKLLEVSPSLEPNYKKILSDLVDEKFGKLKKPLCVIADFFFAWSAKVTHEFGIFHATFCGASGFGLACYYSMWLNLPHRHTDKLEFMLPDFQEAGKFHVTQLSPSLAIADGNDPYSNFQLKNLPTWKNSDGVLFNTIEELDKNGLMYFRRKLCKPVWAIGPILLLQDDRVSTPRKESGIHLDICMEWLDKKEKRSVLYICFGAQNTISASQMMQLAKALDGLEINFIWVIRPPLGFDVNADFKPEEWLPEGFIESVQENEQRGLIVLNWAPQVEILGHESIGAFLSNCGWNSVLESLIGGVPLIGWPMAADQFFNAKFLEEEIGVCVELARGTTFDVRYGDIIEKIELVMGESEKGKRLRGKACEIKEMIKDAARDEDDYKGSSVRAMDEFFNAALLMKERTEIGSQ